MASGLENLKIYQKACELELEVHKVTASFPKDERYRSVDQLRRSSSAPPNNIAEAYHKNTVKAKVHILRNTVITEAEETRTNLLRCAEKEFLPQKKAEELAGRYEELQKATYGYIKFLERKN